MVVGMVGFSWLVSESPTLTLVIGGLLCTSVYLGLGIIEAVRAPLWFSPLSFYFLWYSVGLGFSAAYVANVLSSQGFMSFSLARLPPEDVARAYVIFLLGSVALHAGLQTFRPRTGEGHGASLGTAGRRVVFGLAGLWLLGLWVVWNPSIMAPLGTLGANIRWASLAALCAFVLIPREHLRISRLAFGGLLAIGVTGLFFANLMSYSKAYIMFTFLPLVWMFLLRKELRGWLPLLGGTLAVAYLGLVAPVVTLARDTPLRPGETPASRLVATFNEHPRGFARQSGPPGFREYLAAFLHREFDPAAVGYLVGEVDTYGFQRGDTMAYATYAFIPRILWPEKPAVSRGAWFAAYVGFAPSPEESTMSLGITATGELYWNFGMAGVLFGMFLIGSMFGGLWRLAGPDPRAEPIRMLLYVVVMLQMPNMSEAVTVVTSIVAAYVFFKVLLLVAVMLRQTGRPSSAVFAPR